VSQTEVQTSKETFRHVIGHFASGVTVLTTHHGDDDFGATASAVSSLSLDPPMLLVCLNTRGSTQEAIHASRVFGVNILDEDQGSVAERFATSRGPKFGGLNVDRGVGDVPLLADSLAYCECSVAEDVVAGTAGTMRPMGPPTGPTSWAAVASACVGRCVFSPTSSS